MISAIFQRKVYIPLLLLIIGAGAIWQTFHSRLRRIPSEIPPLIVENDRQPAVPKLSLEPSVLRLGDLWLNSAYEFHAILRNDGDGRVEIERMSAGCGCASLSVSDLSLAPGATAEVRGKLNTGQRETAISKRISAVVGGNPFEIGSVEFNVVPKIKCVPSAVVLAPHYLLSDDGRQKVVIENNGLEEINVALADSNDPQGAIVALLSSHHIPAGSSVDLELRANPSVLVRRRQNLLMRTTCPKESILEIPITIDPQCRLDVAPSQIFLGVVARQELFRDDRFRISISGSALDLFSFEDVRLLTYLEFAGQRTSATSLTLDLVPKEGDEPLPTNLGGSIEIRLRDNRTDGTVVVSVPVSGLLLARRK